MGLKTVKGHKCLQWQFGKYYYETSLKYTTVCQKYNSYYWCITDWDKWDYCKDMKCQTLTDFNCSTNIVWISLKTSIEINLSKISKKDDILVLSYISNELCVMQLISDDCSKNEKRIREIFSICESFTCRSNCLVHDNLKINITYTYYLMPMFSHTSLGPAIKLLLQTRTSQKMIDNTHYETNINPKTNLWIVVVLTVLLIISFMVILIMISRKIFNLLTRKSNIVQSNSAIEDIYENEPNNEYCLIEESIMNEPNNEYCLIEESNMLIETNRPLTIYKSENYFKSDHRIAELTNEFLNVSIETTKMEKRMNLTTLKGTLPKNMSKNRYQNILPYDQSRVLLNSKYNDNNYINANLIPFFYDVQKIEYIASQGPTDTMIFDFWLMIWEQHIQLIVMLTRISENDNLKCKQYWPDSTNYPIIFGKDEKITVYMDNEDQSDIFIERRLTIYNDKFNENRKVTHIQMLSWDDFTIPSFEDVHVVLSRFHELISSNIRAPYLIHCSAGVGRTGTFIVIDRIVRQLQNGLQSLDIFKEVMELRKYRRCMVQLKTQYIFIHEFIEYYVKMMMQYDNNEYSEMSLKW